MLYRFHFVGAVDDVANAADGTAALLLEEYDGHIANPAASSIDIRDRRRNRSGWHDRRLHYGFRLRPGRRGEELARRRLETTLEQPVVLGLRQGIHALRGVGDNS